MNNNLLVDAVIRHILENWGSLASVVGAALTVYFSYRAEGAASNAKRSADATRQKLQSLDVLTELNRLNGRVDDLLLRLEHQAWVVVVERATDLRISIAAIIANGEELFSPEVNEKMAEAVSQFKNIASGADRAAHLDARGPDIARYRRIVADQKEALVLAAQEVKLRMGEVE